MGEIAPHYTATYRRKLGEPVYTGCGLTAANGGV